MGTATLVDERWVPALGHTGYEVSNWGRVRSYWGYGTSGLQLRPRLMVPVQRAQGYLWVNLRRGTQRAVHSLVAEAFLGPLPSGMECRHRNGNKTDPRLENLEYGTRSENYADRERHGTSNRGRWRDPKAEGHLTVEKVRRIRDTTISGVVLAQEMGVSAHTVYAARRYRTWKHLP